MANTVALCMICKNEQSNIGGLMDDVCPVLEQVIVVDTGSTDDTLSILEQKRLSYPNLEIHHFTWTDNFSEARNYSFSLAGAVEWIFWVDGDDRVNQQDLNHFKTHLLDNPGVDAWLLPYIYSKYPDGSAQIYLTRERFLRKSKNPRWVGAIHETVDIHFLRQMNYDGLKIEHNRDGKFIDPRRNLKILAKEFERDPKDHRTAYYYAKELFDHIDPQSTEKLIHYLNLPFKYWDDEIGARFRLAKTYVAENKLREAIQTVEPIYHLDATRRRSEYYFIFGEVEFKLRNFPIAIDWYNRCLSEPPGSPRVLSLEYWSWHPLKKIAECYKEMGHWDKCFEYAQKVCDILPGDRETLLWCKGLQSYRLANKDGYRLATIEFGTNVRFDSYKYGAEPLNVIDANNSPSTVNWIFGDKTPFVPNCLDGVVIDNEVINIANQYGSHIVAKYPITPTELGRVIKPTGFLWTKYALRDGHQPPNHLFNFLGKASYQNLEFYNYVRIDDNKPVLGYKDGNSASAPYRYRIFNLTQSARKQGYKVVEISQCDTYPCCDIYVDTQLNGIRYGKINIIEICEKLDNYANGIEHTDVINCSSRVLADYMKEKFPNKTVINVDDHFEMPIEGWL